MSQDVTISFTTPLGRAWQRMKFFLLHPFDAGRWFAVGFSVFLAGLGNGGGGPSGIINLQDGLWEKDQISQSQQHLSGFMENLADNAGLILLTGFLILAGLVLWILFLWLSSRGRFMFLDNLVGGHGHIQEPWRRFAALGDSLFRWRLGFSLACLVIFGLAAGLLLLLFLPLGLLDHGKAVALPLAVLAGSLVLTLVITVVYIEFFLDHFIVPIMYRHRVGTSEAWQRFRVIFSSNPGSLVAYGLFYLLVSVLGTMVLLAGGTLACCVGLLLLMLPYIGSVVGLPLPVILHFWDLEFLAQFGAEYSLLGPLPADPDHRSIYSDGDGAVIRAEDVSQDAGGDQAGPEDS